MRILLVVLSVFLMSCQTNGEEITNITVAELKAELAKSEAIQLVDVRTPAEWQKGTIKGAMRINVLGDDFVAELEKSVSKEKPVYVYCRSGRRSMKAAKILAKKGYKVYNLIGGYKAWIKETKVEEPCHEPAN